MKLSYISLILAILTLPQSLYAAAETQHEFEQRRAKYQRTLDTIYKRWHTGLGNTPTGRAAKIHTNSVIKPRFEDLNRRLNPTHDLSEQERAFKQRVKTALETHIDQLEGTAPVPPLPPLLPPPAPAREEIRAQLRERIEAERAREEAVLEQRRARVLRHATQAEALQLQELEAAGVDIEEQRRAEKRFARLKAKLRILEGQFQVERLERLPDKLGQNIVYQLLVEEQILSACGIRSVAHAQALNELYERNPELAPQEIDAGDINNACPLIRARGRVLTEERVYQEGEGHIAGFDIAGPREGEEELAPFLRRIRSFEYADVEDVWLMLNTLGIQNATIIGFDNNNNIVEKETFWTEPEDPTRDPEQAVVRAVIERVVQEELVTETQAPPATPGHDIPAVEEYARGRFREVGFTDDSQLDRLVAKLEIELSKIRTRQLAGAQRTFGHRNNRGSLIRLVERLREEYQERESGMWHFITYVAGFSSKTGQRIQAGHWILISFIKLHRQMPILLLVDSANGEVLRGDAREAMTSFLFANLIEPLYATLGPSPREQTQPTVKPRSRKKKQPPAKKKPTKRRTKGRGVSRPSRRKKN